MEKVQLLNLLLTIISFYPTGWTKYLCNVTLSKSSLVTIDAVTINQVGNRNQYVTKFAEKLQPI